MVTTFISVILFSFFLLKGHCINVEGPPKVRYRPCGLGPLHFDKINETYWKGVLDLGSYSTLEQSPEVVITFKKENTLIETTTSDDFTIEKENRSLIIYVDEILTEPIVFDVKLNSLVNESVPTVEAFSLNDNIICDNETVWASQMLDEPLMRLNNALGQSNSPVCGQRCLDCEETTTLRTEAKDGDWPWHVALLRDNKYFCGGTIVSKTAVVTSGWCGYYKNRTLPVTVFAGSSNFIESKEQRGRQILNATDVILGPGYASTHTNNLAIIKVNEFIFNKYVQPICIFGPQYDKTSLVGKEAVVAGFGGTTNPSRFGVLRSTDTTLRSDDECKKTFKNIKIVVTETHFCGGFGETSNLNPHHSDPGSGLVVSSIGMDQRVTWYLRGVFVSCYRKEGICQPNQYALYFDTAPFYSWILHHSG